MKPGGSPVERTSFRYTVKAARSLTNTLNHSRRVATRFDKLAARYLPVVTLAAIRLRARFGAAT